MSPFSLRKQDPVFFTGLIAIAASFAFFVSGEFFPGFRGSDTMGLFGINFMITVAYFVVLVASRRLKKGQNGLFPFLLFLILFLISAYALNRAIKVFEISPTWFCVVLVLVSGNYIAIALFTKVPEWIRYILFGIAGVSICVFAYLAIYLIPVYPFSAMLSPGLGISMHGFVPLLFCFFTVKLIRIVGNNRHRKAFFAGIAVTILFTAGYVGYWYRDLANINHYYRYASITENNRLPGWVNVAQHTKPDAMSERILKTGLVYSVAKGLDEFSWQMPRANFGARIHDPFIMISSFFCGPVNVPEEERVKVLETLFDSRHQAQQRLWSGDDIRTEHVSTTVQLWPGFRTSYTEMNLTVAHVASQDNWNFREEAIYTFHVPEGGVVTALSLWIDGHEEKGVLTSKEKADTAYTTIVGKESHDPSVLHWQEGNTITVRVFPVRAGEDRKFRIGITAPLRYEQNRLSYDNIYFDGPSFHGCTEDLSVTSRDNLQHLFLPPGFTREGNSVQREGAYAPVWSLSCDAPPVSRAAFQFNGCTYRVEPLEKQVEFFTPDSVYLDINGAWTSAEAERTYQLVKDKKLFVSTGADDLQELTAENRARLFNSLRQNRFSLFPFSKIATPARSLVITRSGPLSPTISDLRTSHFLQQQAEFFRTAPTLRLFDLGQERSPYLKSLKEFRVLGYAHGTEQTLQRELNCRQFEKTVEGSDLVSLEPAGLAVRRSSDTVQGHAPDHLMRLFAYNHILAESGRQLLAGEQENESIVKEAQEAYVVSPCSSLVVLEKQADYDRFNIKENKNSLQNATLKSKGSVPEPGEWALACLALLVCLISGYRRSYRYVPFNRTL